MTTYQAGHVKRDPETGRVAVRTILSDSEKAWLGSTTYRGSFFANTETVADWDDLYVPPAAPEQPA